jgi:glutamyl-tRNA synthetase
MTCRLALNPGASPFPYGPLVLATYIKALTKIDIQFDSSVDTIVLEHNGTQVTSINDILNAIAKESNFACDSVKVREYISHSPNEFSSTIQASAFLSVAETLPSITSFPELVAALDSLDDHLTLRTFLLGNDVTIADWGVWGSLKCVWYAVEPYGPYRPVSSVYQGSRSVEK